MSRTIYVPTNGHMLAFRTTRKDPDGHKLYEVLGILGARYNLRLTRASAVQDAIARYGFTGPLISGIEQDHWPENVKTHLRANARDIGKCADDAMKVWLGSGRRLATFRALLHLPLYAVEGSRY